MPPDRPPAPYGVNQVGHGGPVNSDFSQLVPLARLPESQDPVGSRGRVPGRRRSSPVDLVVLGHGTGPPSLPWTRSQVGVVLPCGPGGSPATGVGHRASPDGTPAPNGVNEVGHGGPVNSDFSQVVPLARFPESQDPVGSPSDG